MAVTWWSQEGGSVDVLRLDSGLRRGTDLLNVLAKGGLTDTARTQLGETFKRQRNWLRCPMWLHHRLRQRKWVPLDTAEGEELERATTLLSPLLPPRMSKEMLDRLKPRVGAATV